MDKSEQKGLLDRFQDYLDTPKGRILLNYLYSWGAAIVILGALFKLTHIGGANMMLFIGMGTEVLVFFISGFEKPFIPNKNGKAEDDYLEDDESAMPVGRLHGMRKAGVSLNVANESAPSNNVQQVNPVQNATTGGVTGQGAQAGGNLQIDGVEAVTQEYLNMISNLTEKMSVICNQSEKIGQSTEEIDTLGRNLISINTFYEMHLRSVSSQMDNIDKVNDQTRHMLEQIEELNRVYARMVEAMKVNSQMGKAE